MPQSNNTIRLSDEFIAEMQTLAYEVYREGKRVSGQEDVSIKEMQHIRDATYKRITASLKRNKGEVFYV